MEKWIAVYTKSRHEKAVIKELENKNIEVEIVSSHYVDPKGERVRS